MKKSFIRQNLAEILSGLAAGAGILILTLLYAMKSDIAVLQSYIKVDEAMHTSTKTELVEIDERLRAMEVWQMFLERKYNAENKAPVNNELFEDKKIILFRPEEKYIFTGLANNESK